MLLHAVTAVILLALCSPQALAHPATYTDVELASNGTTTNSSDTSTYTVVSGDTLNGIAAAEVITLAELEDANPGVEPTNLQVGEVLDVPIQASPTGTR
jgi:LysM repeat protein